MKIKAIFAALAAVFSAPALANPVVVIHFDDMINNVYVNHFYNGGTDSGMNSGPNLGVQFVGFITAPGVGATSTPNFAYNNYANSYINVAGGFTALDFTVGSLAPATISVYSGLNGTGTLLGSGVFNGNAMAFVPGSVAFSGLARSVRLNGTINYTGLDDVSLTLPIPEPDTWAMLLAGLGIAGFAARRRALRG